MSARARLTWILACAFATGGAALASVGCSSDAGSSQAATAGAGGSSGAAPGLTAGSPSVSSAGSAGVSGVGGSSAGGGSAGTAGDPGTAGAAGATGGASAASAGAAGGAACLPPAAAVPAGTLTMHIAGDSTSAIFPSTDPRVGWGAVFQPFVTSAVKVNDGAQSGRSSKSFINEGFWTTMKAQIKTGDYVFIEFGHNDEKTDDPLRYTDPATTFRDYLRTYVCETRALGGIPILLTPISRRSFTGNVITPTHGAYPAAVMAVGTETSTPVIDMTTRTKVWLEAVGQSASFAMFAPNDTTHLSAMGAPEVGKLVAQGIKDANLPLASELAP